MSVHAVPFPRLPSLRRVPRVRTIDVARIALVCAAAGLWSAADAAPPVPASATAQSAPGAAAEAAVIVNGQALAPTRRQAIERSTGVPLRPGRWWYDARSGLWGAEGQGAAGFAPAGLDVGAPLRVDASGGSTGVFFNGRNLTAAEVAWLQTLGPVWPGRYWLDAWSSVGLEGQALPFTNLYMLAAQRRGAAAGNSTTRSGTWIASGGGCVIVSGKSSSGIGSFGASTC